MNLQGFIKSIGEPRTFQTNRGEDRYSYPITISVPYVNARGEEKADEVISDHIAANPEYIDKLRQAQAEGKRMEFSLYFSVREWQGKKFQNCVLNNVTVLL